MSHPDEPALVTYVAEHPSATALAVYDATDLAAAAAALRAAAAEICRIRHPDEPDMALPNWCEVLDEDGVPVLHLDMKDEVRYAALVVRIVLDQLAAAAVDGRLAPRREPDAAVAYDANADLYTAMDPLTQLDGRGLPPGFPDSFPVPPQATLVMAQRGRDGGAEHVAWRRSTGPFSGYLERLAEYGCTFGAVPRLLTVGSPPGMVQYTLWRAGAGGRVALYQASGRRSPTYWYVSVVWQEHVEPPATPVEPDEEPDTRPVPTGPAAIRERACERTNVTGRPRAARPSLRGGVVSWPNSCYPRRWFPVTRRSSLSPPPPASWTSWSKRRRTRPTGARHRSWSLTGSPRYSVGSPPSN